MHVSVTTTLTVSVTQVNSMSRGKMISLFENDCLCSNKSQTPFERACTRACNLNSIRLCYGLFDYVIIS